MKSTKVIVVDEQDNEIGTKERENMMPSDRYRVSALWIVDEEGRVLLARRSYTKKNHPGVWGPAVAGTVEEGETYDSNIVKEAMEELGLRIEKIESIRKLHTQGDYDHFTQCYRWVYDGQEIVAKPDEVAEVKWWSRTELEKAIEQTPEDFIPGFSVWLEFM